MALQSLDIVRRSASPTPAPQVRKTTEVAKLIELHLLTLQEHFHQAGAHIREYALHLTSGVTTMVGNVLYKLSERQHLVHLSLCVSQRSLLRMDRVSQHVSTILNHSFAHRRYGDWYFHMQLMCPTRFVVTSELRCKGTT